MIGTDVDICPNDVDLNMARKLVHTPKTGEQYGFDREYYEDQARANVFLKEFYDKYEGKLQG